MGGLRHLYNQKRSKLYRKNLRNNITKAEEILWYYLKGKKILGVKFRRQFGIGKYIVDFYSPKLKFAIEVDDSSHVDSYEYDQKRTNYLNKHNIHILRFWNHEVYTKREYVISSIKKEIAKHA